MTHKTVKRSLTTFAATAASVLMMQAPAFADTTLADVTLPFPLAVHRCASLVPALRRLKASPTCTSTLSCEVPA